MKEGVFDLILQKWYIKYLEPLLDMRPFFEFFSRKKKYSTPADTGDPSVLQFFNVDSASEITVSMESVTGIYLIHERTNTGLNRLLARFYKKESRTDFGLNNSTVTVYLPEKQVVYPKDFSEINRDYIFINPVENFSGKLIDARTGSEKDVMFIEDRETLTLHHLINGVKTTIEFRSTIYAPESDNNPPKRRFDKKMTK